MLRKRIRNNPNLINTTWQVEALVKVSYLGHVFSTGGPFSDTQSAF